jgi:hypothetical protein
LLANDTDADSDTLTFVTNSATTNGLTVVRNGNQLLVPTNGVNDAFQYTIQDGYGGTNTGWVYITLSGNYGQGKGVAANTNGTATATFYGIPGFTYVVERATNVNFTLGFTNLSTNTVSPTNGEFTVTDTFSDLGGVPASAFYRLSAP